MCEEYEGLFDNGTSNAEKEHIVRRDKVPAVSTFYIHFRI